MANSIRVAYGEKLIELGEKNDKIVVFDADLSSSTQTGKFKAKFPDRFYNLGIAEANMMCTAAAFARTGYIPFVSTFAMFGVGRGFEQIRNSICYTKCNVKLCFTHAGVSCGEDGGSHQTIEDIALMREMPYMTVFVPCDPIETKKAVEAAVEINGPVYIRLARPATGNVTAEDTPFIPGKANVLREGTDVCLIACGLMVEQALKAAEELEKEGISAAVVDMHTIKPIDKETILKMNESCKAIITVEEHTIYGGLGSAVSEVLAGHDGAKFGMIGIMDRFGQSGTPNELFEVYGLTAGNIVARAKEILK